MFGSHLSIAGGLVNALLEARRLKMDCVQVFTRNQRQWNARDPRQEETDQWLAQLQRMNWDFTLGNSALRGRRVVSHNSYLINLAQPDAALWKKSIAAQRKELERCEALHIPLCVTHPGAHLSETRIVGSANDLTDAISKAERAGLHRIARALDSIHRDLPGYRAITCLETTVGSGSNLGYNFHQLAYIRQQVREPQRLGFCFDTCHVTAAGYDMSTASGAQAVLQQWDAICGLESLCVFHVNDSIGELGSRRDRHAHIGQGCCGRCCFRVIVNHPAFQTVPKILETPKGKSDNGVEWDRINLRRLRRMRSNGTVRHAAQSMRQSQDSQVCV